jgi:ribosomal protein S12 methylthiotransferase accessory factor YcaO
MAVDVNEPDPIPVGSTRDRPRSVRATSPGKEDALPRGPTLPHGLADDPGVRDHVVAADDAGVRVTVVAAHTDRQIPCVCRVQARRQGELS